MGEFRDLLPLVLPSDAVLVRAKELHLTRGASFWDALILAACVDSGVEILYSEDVPGFDGFEGVRGPEVARRGRSRPTWQCP